MLTNAYGIGGSLQSLIVSRLIAECGQYEGLPMNRGMNLKIKTESALNPFYTALAFIKDVLIQWTKWELSSTAILEEGEKFEDTSSFRTLEIEIEEIENLKSMSEVETRLDQVGLKVKRMSFFQAEDILPFNREKST